MTALLIAQNTFREAIRDRVLAGVVGMGVLLFLLIQLAKPLAMGEGLRLSVDLGLSSISLLGLLVVLLVGTSLVGKEIERRTIFNMLSRPLPRPVYLLGKWAGLTLSLWTVAVILGVVLWLVLALQGQARYAASLAEAVYMAGLELSVITAIATFFSALSTPVLSALYTLGAFLAGSWASDLRAFAAGAPDVVRVTLESAANLVPNLSLFNIRTLAAEGAVTTPEHLILATLYAALYSGCVLALGAAAFESRDFR